MNTAILRALDFIAAQLVDIDFLPPAPFDQYAPAATGLTAANIDTVLNTYLAAVRSRWQEANTAGLISLIDQAKAKAAQMASAPAKQPIPGLEASKPELFEFRLDLNIAAGDDRRNMLGRALASGSGAVPAALPAKIDAVRQLRRVDDTLIRVLAVKQASQATSVPMAEVMAFYRTEGNLDVPAGFHSQLGLVPSDSPAALSHVSHMPPHPEAESSRMFPHLVWLSRHSIVYLGFTGTFPQSAPADVFKLKEPALIDWMLHLCGFDEMQKLYATAQGANSPMKDVFAIFSQDNWTRAGVPSTPAAAVARWNSLVNNLEASAVTSGATPAFSVTPKVPVAFVAGVLAEGLMRMRHKGSTDSFRYLVYHAGQEQAVAITIRGLIAARNTKGARYKQLRDAIAADAAFTGMLASLEARVKIETDTKRAIAELFSAFQELQRWLSTDEAIRLPLVEEFLETASTTIWPNWKEHRGNLSRYVQLLDYYRRVFP